LHRKRGRWLTIITIGCGVEASEQDERVCMIRMCVTAQYSKQQCKIRTRKYTIKLVFTTKNKLELT
jgi:hypothetical protein